MEIPEVKGKPTQIQIGGVSKCFFGLHGSHNIRSDAAIKARKAKHNQARLTKQW